MLHHANIILGENVKDFVFGILKNELDFETKGNPDFLIMESEPFGIDDARFLEKWAIGKPLSGQTKVVFIAAKSITFESQNALLKILEEPLPGTYIFIAVQKLGSLLPTILSRVMVLELTAKNESQKKDAKKFLRSKINERLAMIKPLSKKEDKDTIRNLINDLEEAAYENGNYNPDSLKKILTAKMFASGRGSSPKIILEWLATVI